MTTPSAIWVGGPKDGVVKAVPKKVLDQGYLEVTEINRKTNEMTDYRYPVRRVAFNPAYDTFWRIYYNERTQR